MFDKIMIIDKGGYLIFYGNPSEAIVYFKTKASYANALEDQCILCGNIESDQLLQIIEAKVINENGKQTRIRKVSPKEWAEKFLESHSTLQKSVPEKKVLPENYYSIPGLFKQSKIFFLRDLLSKLANRQYVLISLLGSPLLAFLLAYFTKYKINGEYSFSENENLPAYLFMCVITSLFLGLIISAEEIVKDRKILKRESFLNLSWFSYLNSKIMIMFLISAIQTISFILIGNYILEIRGMNISYWIVLFTTSCFANILGLNISAAFSSVITIYILIPFILIPELLFSGVIVKFDKLHENNHSTYEYVPVIGDMMASRWSFEALAVEQFRNNRYEKNFFKYDLEISQNDWYSLFLIKALETDLRVCKVYKDSLDYRQDIIDNLYKLNYYIDKLNGLAGFGPIKESWKTNLDIENFNAESAKKAGIYLDSLSGQFKRIRRQSWEQKELVNRALESKLGRAEYIKLRDRYYNKYLERTVLDPFRVDKSIETHNRIIQKFEPGYMKPTSKSGRAHFYAPYKQIGNIKIDTYWFNVIVLWLVSLALYIALYYNILQKFTEWLGNLKLKEINKL
jgi:hypothetical protein